MSQVSNLTIANDSGLNVRTDLQNSLQAIWSQNSGASAPTATTPYMLWGDTTTAILKIRNAGDTAWIPLVSLDGLTWYLGDTNNKIELSSNILNVTINSTLAAKVDVTDTTQPTVLVKHLVEDPNAW